MCGLMGTGIIPAGPIRAAAVTGHARAPAIHGPQAVGSTITGVTTGKGAAGKSINFLSDGPRQTGKKWNADYQDFQDERR